MSLKRQSFFVVPRFCWVLLLLLTAVTGEATTLDDFPGFKAACPAMLDFVGEYAFFPEAQAEAFRQFPSSPIERGETLRRLLMETSPKLAARVLAFDAKGMPQHNGQSYGKLACEAVTDLNTVRYRSGAGRVPAGSRVFLPLLHGTGATWSHAGAMLQMLYFLTSPRKDGDFFGALERLGNRIPVAAEIIDQPGAGAGPSLSKLRELDAAAAWFEKWFRDIKSLGLPVVPICRSGMGGLIPYLNARHPGLFDAIVLLSPEHPDPKIGASHSTAVIHHELARREYVPNLLALDWLMDLYAQMNAREDRYYAKDLPFAGTPTLILFGGKDPEVSEASRETYRKYAELSKLAGYDNVVVRVFPEANHDVFAKNGRTDATAVSAYNLLYWFLKAHVLHDRTAIPIR